MFKIVRTDDAENRDFDVHYDEIYRGLYHSEIIVTYPCRLGYIRYTYIRNTVPSGIVVLLISVSNGPLRTNFSILDIFAVDDM